MSIDPYEAEQEEWYSRLAEELYAEHKERAIGDFITERLRSYYLANPDVTVPALRMYEEGTQLEKTSTIAAVVFFVSATELALKFALLKPVVFGLVHNEPLAGVVAEITVRKVGIDQLHGLLLRILEEYGGIDVNTFHMDGHTKTLWDEMRKVQGVRNAIVHRGQIPNPTDVQLAKEVATTIISTFLNRVLNSLELKLVKGGSIAAK